MRQIQGKMKAKQLTLRLPASLHEALLGAAAAEGMPVNTYCLYILARHDICTANNPIKKINTKKTQGPQKKT